MQAICFLEFLCSYSGVLVMQVEKGSPIFKFWDSLDSRFSPVINLRSIFTKGCNRFLLPRPKATFVEVTFLRLKEAFPHIDCLNDGQNDSTHQT